MNVKLHDKHAFIADENSGGGKAITTQANMLNANWNSVVVPILCVCVLTGCTTTHTIDATPEIVARHARQGYLDQRFRDVHSVRDQWQIDGQAVDVLLTAPADDGVYPLVIYLPGLGEPVDGGAVWRRTWTEAGYAVLSIQPVSTGTSVWSSEAALEGNFREIAQAQFSRHALVERVTLVGDVWRELKRRRNSNASALFNHVDMTRVAVAGFDIGAQTAMALAGERADKIPAVPFRAAIECVIALSPSMNADDSDRESRYRSINVPVLSITSPDDTDPYGWVVTAAVRQEPFRYMPRGKKYLLLLKSASHSLLAGREIPATEKDRGEHADVPGTANENHGSHSHRRGNRNGGSGDQNSVQSDRHAGHLTLSEDLFSVFDEQEITDIQQISTAFLDANTKQIPKANKWLAKDAGRWLGKTVALFSK